jgi:hypothetical protein
MLLSLLLFLLGLFVDAVCTIVAHRVEQLASHPTLEMVTRVHMLPGSTALRDDICIWRQMWEYVIKCVCVLPYVDRSVAVVMNPILHFWCLLTWHTHGASFLRIGYAQWTSRRTWLFGLLS